MSQASKLHRKDNGYFEVWMRACGHAYRVTTEYYSGSAKAQMIKNERARCAGLTCKRCQVGA